MSDDKNFCISNHREEMTVIYVKLEEDYQAALYEQFDSAISTMESTNATLYEPCSTPYVDATNFNSGKNYEKMKKLLLTRPSK